MQQRDPRGDIAAKLGPRTGDLISLFHLPPDDGIAQRDLGARWGCCDPSWVTTRIDPLEKLGGFPLADLRTLAGILAKLDLPT